MSTRLKNRKPAAPPAPPAPQGETLLVTHTVRSEADVAGEPILHLHTRAVVSVDGETIELTVASSFPDTLPRGGTQRTERLEARRDAHERLVPKLGATLVLADRRQRDAHDRIVRELVLRGKNQMLKEATGLLAPQRYATTGHIGRPPAQAERDVELALE